MHLVTKLTFLLLLYFSLVQCTNQRTEGRGKLRLHTMFLKKDDVLNLQDNQTLYFNIDFENRKMAKEHLRLAGFRYQSGENKFYEIAMRYSESDTIVAENKVFGNYFLKKETIAKIRAMAARGELNHTDHFLLKPLILDDEQRLISYELYVGSRESVFATPTGGSTSVYLAPANYQNSIQIAPIDQLDPSPPAPPHF